MDHCNFLLKNNSYCKNKISKQLYNKIYCTRHYNILSKQDMKNGNADDDLKKDIDTSELKKDTNITDLKKDIHVDTSVDTGIDIDIIDEIKNINIIEEPKKNELIKILNLLKINFTELEYINDGTFLNVYKIKINNEYYAIKFQLLTEKIKGLLYFEYQLLYNHICKNDYIVKLPNNNSIKPYYGKNNEYMILFNELLHETLTEKKNRYKFNIDEIKNIGIQLIKGIAYIHSKKYLYIDLKPDNIMFTSENENKLKIIDFNACSKYINIYSEFYENVQKETRQGNDVYSSININNSFTGLRIDDMESILWILLDLLNDPIINKLKLQKKIKDIIKIKETFIKNISDNYEFKFIKPYILELKKYDLVNNKLPDYKKFINILQI